MNQKEEVPAVCCPHHRDQCFLHARSSKTQVTPLARQRQWTRALDRLLDVDPYPDVDTLYPRVTLRESA